jgi:tRNA modification GTPase
MTDTIVAIATAPGRGGIGVVRVSGPQVPEVAQGLVGELPPARIAVHRAFRDARGEALDLGLVLYFPGPASYTGESVLELHGHGAPWALAALVERAVALGARPARPGEFSERAFLNGKLDLAQAEALADLISAGSAGAARAALRSLEGAFSARVDAILERLVALRMEVEAGIDFSDEALELKAGTALESQAREIVAALESLAREAEQGRLLRDGVVVVLAGRPNAGKSSLMNRLAGHEAAIVTAIPGTTRDLLREHLTVNGLAVELVDTAGLAQSPELIEAEGIRRAHTAMSRADLILYLVDASDPAARQALGGELRTLPQVPVIVLYNKCDLLDDVQSRAAAREGTALTVPALLVSARTGAGLPEITEKLVAAAGYAPGVGGTFSARRRHLEALARTARHVESARRELGRSAAQELAAEELRLAQECLGEVTGRFTSEDLLGRIFSEFCIGK